MTKTIKVEKKKRIEEIPLEIKKAVSDDNIPEIFRLTRELYDMIKLKDKQLEELKAGIKDRERVMSDIKDNVNHWRDKTKDLEKQLEEERGRVKILKMKECPEPQKECESINVYEGQARHFKKMMEEVIVQRDKAQADLKREREEKEMYKADAIRWTNAVCNGCPDFIEEWKCYETCRPWTKYRKLEQEKQALEVLLASEKKKLETLRHNYEHLRHGSEGILKRNEDLETELEKERGWKFEFEKECREHTKSIKYKDDLIKDLEEKVKGLEEKVRELEQKYEWQTSYKCKKCGAIDDYASDVGYTNRVIDICNQCKGTEFESIKSPPKEPKDGDTDG